jgi:HEPN domain-containing protein
MEEWEKFFDEGLAYCKVAIGAKSKGKLGNTVIYNTVGLALESLLMAVLAQQNMYPEHSSIGTMLHAIKKFAPVPDEFTTEARFLNSFMNFCALEVAEERIPTDEEIERMVGFAASLKDWVGQNLKVA